MKKIEIKLATTTNDENIYVHFFIPTKSKWKPVNQFLVKGVENVKSLLLATSLSIKILAIKIEVNNEVKIPINNVVANP